MLALAGPGRELAGSRSSITFVPRPQDDPTMRRADITLARRLLGREPKLRLRVGDRLVPAVGCVPAESAAADHRERRSSPGGIRRSAMANRVIRGKNSLPRPVPFAILMRDRALRGELRGKIVAVGVRRVCVVGSGWHFLSGISFHTCRTANALAQRYDVSAILMRKLLPARLYPGAARVGQALTNLRYRDEVHVTDGVDYYWLPGLVRALLHLRRTRPEVVLFQWWSGTVLHTYLILAACTRLLGGKVLIEFHEVLDTAEAAHPWFSRYVNLFTRPLIAMTDGGVIHSEFDRQPVLDRFRLGDRPLVVVPVGSYDHFGEQDPSDVDSAPGGVCRLLYFGTIRPYKGLEHLVQVFNALTADEAARFHLTVVGETWEGWHRPLDMIEVSPHRDRITLVNRYVHDDEVAAFFRQADAVVLPYLRSSASGPLHIAMSFGLPVAVTRVGGLAEAAAEYEGARMVEPGSLTDLRAALMDLPTLAGTRYPDPHSWDANAERLAGLFDIVTGRPAAPDPAISG